MLPDWGADGGRVLPYARRPRRRHCKRAGVCALCGYDLVRDLGTESRRGRTLRNGAARKIPRKAAGIQLLALLSLEAETERTGDCLFSDTAGRNGVQVPVCDPGGIS